MGAVTGARGARGATGPAAAIIPFGLLNVATGDDAVAVNSTPAVAPWCGVTGLGVGWVAPRAGSVTALSAALSAAAAGADAVVGVYKNGTLLGPATSVTMTEATSDTKAHTTFTAGDYAFVAGDILDVRVRTGSAWTATAADLGAAVEVTF